MICTRVSPRHRLNPSTTGTLASSLPLEHHDHLTMRRVWEHVHRLRQDGLKGLARDLLATRAAERLQVDHHGARRVAAHVNEALNEVCFADGLQAVLVQASARRVDHGDDAAATSCAVTA
mmetsp:Transcript_42683/g.133792  ORF Transcript_42683/g.133792 Transcript_42683/m.133792 type:complete len:120 (-) Transcript_42683:107-466(-)